MRSGSAWGIKKGGNSPSVSYTVPRDYRTVFLRAQNQDNECLRGKDQYVVRSNVNPVAQTGVVDVVGPFGDVLVARTKLEATDAKHTHVTQTVWGRSPWDVNEIGRASCRERGCQYV